MRILGVDPGLQGALAIWDGLRLEVVDVPIVKARGRGNEINLPALADVVHRLAPFDAAYVERNSVRPLEGISSAQKNGLVAGILLGCITMCCRLIDRPTPQFWKRAMKLTKDKEYSRTKAIEMFPDYYELFARKKDHGRAEAALLALYGYRQHQANAPRKRLRRKL